MAIEQFSPKQLCALTWWCRGSSYHSRDAIICDGAVRSGKTTCMALSFILWSMGCFDSRAFGLCGKTIVSLRRNVLHPLLGLLDGAGLRWEYKPSQGELNIRRGQINNTYYLYGGRDEGSAALIQGVTLAGVLLDEVALMPRSFVEQALARCSVAGSRFWFNCNPEHPGHWFYLEWIQQAGKKNALYLHFTMEDNPSLGPEVVRRYHSLYTGVFYERYVLGRWCAAHGAVYPMFEPCRHVVEQLPENLERYAVSCDYGTVNPASFGLWGQAGGVWYRMEEYYHDSRRAGYQCTDEEYAAALERLCTGRRIEAIIVDPSAASFIRCLRSREMARVVPAVNNVLDGIRRVSSALQREAIRFHSGCADAIREFGLYRWDLTVAGDVPRKENDHAMDDIRYFVTWMEETGAGSGFAAIATERRRK